MSLGKKVFAQKGVGSNLYLWSPQPNNFSNKKTSSNGGGGNSKPFYCNATAGSQGQDWVTTYTYNLEVVDYQQAHFAYVECDYVQ